MRSVLGSVRWAHKTVIDVAYDLNRLSTWVTMPECQISEVNRLNKIVRCMRDGHKENGNSKPQHASLFIPKLEKDQTFKITFIVDAGEPKNDALYRGKWMGMQCIGFQADDEEATNVNEFGLLHHRAGLTRRVSNSSLDGETNSFIEGLDVALSCALLFEELEYGVRTSIWEKKVLGLRDDDGCAIACEGHTDSDDLVKASTSLVYAGQLSKRRRADVYDIQELQQRHVLRPLKKIAGLLNPTDAGTKAQSYQSQTMKRLRELAAGRYVLRQ